MMKHGSFFLLFLVFTLNTFSRTYSVTNQSSEHDPTRDIYHIDEWSKLMERIDQDEDTDHHILFRPGHYIIKKQLLIHDKKNITIKGLDDVLLDPQRKPISPSLFTQCTPEEPCKTKPWQKGQDWIAQYANMRSFATFHLARSHHIKIEHLSITNSWPNAFIVFDKSDHIDIDHVDVTYGTNVLYAEGPAIQHLSLTNSSWNQDPSEELWSKRDWKHVHHGLFNYFNGAFVQARNIKGHVEVRNNRIKNAFNGIRMKVTSEYCPNRHHCVLNTDVSITNNQFLKISDNVIEPEYFASSWLVHFNTLIGVYAPFSFDGVQSFNFKILHNHVEAMELPRTEIPASEFTGDLHQGSRLFKLKSYGGDLKHDNFIVRSNVFKTTLNNADKCQRFTDVPALTATMSFINNTLCNETYFNRNNKIFPSFFEEQNELLPCF